MTKKINDFNGATMIGNHRTLVMTQGGRPLWAAASAAAQPGCLGGTNRPGRSAPGRQAFPRRAPPPCHQGDAHAHRSIFQHGRLRHAVVVLICRFVATWHSGNGVGVRDCQRFRRGLSAGFGGWGSGKIDAVRSFGWGEKAVAHGARPAAGLHGVFVHARALALTRARAGWGGDV